MAGELERLGPKGRDILVLRLDAPDFETLDKRQKIFAYYLTRAAIAGDHIMYMQNHRDALEIKRLLETIFLHSEGMDAGLKEAVHEYLKYIWIHHGPYHHYTHTKFVPNHLTMALLSSAVEHSIANGAEIDTRPGETLEEKLERLERVIFDATFEPHLSNRSGAGDVITSSAVNFYQKDVTMDDVEGLISYWRNKLNVRFAKVDGSIVPQIFKIGGLYTKELETVCHFLKRAIPYAETPEQKTSLKALIDYFSTGDEALFREHSIHWLHSNTTIDYLNGFIEQYKDPRGIIGNYEANVTYKVDSKPVEKLAASVLYFEKKMPWPDVYKRETIDTPVATVANVIIGTGDCGPVSPAAYNLPNYNDIRRDHGSKNVILLNIERSRPEKVFKQVVEEFYLPEYRDVVLKYAHSTIRPWEVTMHEIIGHGSGKPAPDLPADPRILLGSSYSALEECRADLVALYHFSDPKLPEIGAFSKNEQADIVNAAYIYYLQGWLSRYDRIEGLEVREAHNMGSQLILMYLVENGGDPEKDFGVRVIEKGGDFFVQLEDTQKMHQGLGELLSTLQRIKSTGDMKAAAALFARFGTAVRPDWKGNILKRKERLNIPRLMAFVYPHLIPVIEDGDVVDVEIAYDEDLTAQCLRFSRLQYVTSLEENQ